MGLWCVVRAARFGTGSETVSEETMKSPPLQWDLLKLVRFIYFLSQFCNPHRPLGVDDCEASLSLCYHWRNPSRITSTLFNDLVYDYIYYNECNLTDDHLICGKSAFL